MRKVTAYLVTLPVPSRDDRYAIFILIYRATFHKIFPPSTTPSYYATFKIAHVSRIFHQQPVNYSSGLTIFIHVMTEITTEYNLW